MERSTEAQKNRLEITWLNHDLAKSTTWFTYKNTQRDYVHGQKEFVVWDLIDGHPRLFDVLKTAEVGVSWDEGMIFILKSSQYENQYTVSGKPRELIAGVFFWIPGFADVRYAPFQYTVPGSARRLTAPIMFRTAHSHQVEGARYISSMKDFNEAWPGIFRD